MPVVSLRLPAVTADLSSRPRRGSALVLRHYEAIRKMMSQIQPQLGLDLGHRLYLPGSRAPHCE